MYYIEKGTPNIKKKKKKKHFQSPSFSFSFFLLYNISSAIRTAFSPLTDLNVYVCMIKQVEKEGKEYGKIAFFV